MRQMYYRKICKVLFEKIDRFPVLLNVVFKYTLPIVDSNIEKFNTVELQNAACRATIHSLSSGRPLKNSRSSIRREV